MIAMISHSFIVLLTISFFSIAVIQAKASIREGYDKIITEESLVQEKDNPEFYEPTPEELSRGVAFAPPSYWGVLLRKKKSLRIAFIGGSQTAYSWSYTYIFKSSMEKISNEMNWTFAVYNEGQVGHAPEARSFNFFKLNQSLWPNVIGIEPCLNCVGSEPYPCSSWIDNMKYFINGIYRSSGLDLPYYIFLEFFGADENYRQNNKHWNDITTKVALPINQTKVQELSDPTAKTMINRGTPYGPYMMALARFYAIPVLSVTEILFPSFVRFHITHVEYERWPYTQDGIHASPLGCEIFVKHVMVPFFMSQMTPRDSDNIYESKPRFGPYDPVDVRMLPPKHYSDIMILGHWRAMNSDILNIVEPNSTLWFLHPFRGHADQEHTCYGTNSTTSMTSRFRLNVKPECLGGSCIISVHYLHSWNTSYIASATCNLYNIVDVGGDKVHSSHLVSTVNIAPNICGHDNSEPVTGTHMCSHELKVGQLTQEVIFHSIECVNNEFNKLACIGGIEFYVKS